MNLIYLIPLSINFLIVFFTYRYFISNLNLYQMASSAMPLFPIMVKGFMIFFALMTPVFFIAGHNGFAPLLVRFSSYFMGMVFLLFFVAILYLLFVLLFKVTGITSIATSSAVVKAEILIVITTFFYILLAFIGGAKAPMLKQVDIHLKNFSKNDYKIVQLSDLHIGPANNKEWLQNIVDRVNKLKPNLVVLTGDIIDVPAEFIISDLQPLKTLNAPIFAVLGNHEYYNGIYAIKPILKQLGITLLDNQSQIIDESFNLIGINDPTGKRMGEYKPDFTKAIANRDSSLPSILLAHQPTAVKDVDSSIDLMLCGHTHNGQIIPFKWLLPLAHPYVSGLHRDKRTGTQVYVNSGTGFWGPPMRLGSRSEITYLVVNPVSKLIEHYSDSK